MKKLILGLFVSVIMVSCSHKIDEIDADYQAQTYVRSLLKSPSSADFGVGKVVEFGEKKFSIDSYVDSQNGFGSMVRTYYSCTITYSDDCKKYTISDFRTSNNQ